MLASPVASPQRPALVEESGFLDCPDCGAIWQRPLGEMDLDDVYGSDMGVWTFRGMHIPFRGVGPFTNYYNRRGTIV